MAFANLNGSAWFPRLPNAVATQPSSGLTVNLDASGEGIALMCTAPKTGSIRKIICRTNTVTGAGTFTARLKEIDRSATPAIPHATNLSHVNATGDQAVITSDDNTTFAVQLTADAAVTKGDRLCVELIITTLGTLTSLRFVSLDDERNSLSGWYPYTLQNTGGSYTVPVVNLSVSFEYSDGTIAPTVGVYPQSGDITTTTFGSGSTPDTIGQRFQFAMPVRVGGFWLWCDADDAFTVRLVTTTYHQANATGILTSYSVNTQDRSTNGAGILQFPFVADIDLDANTNYRLLIEPGATGVTVYDQAFGSLAQMDASELGSKFHLTTAKDPTGDGSWTNHNSGTFRQLYCGLLLKGFSDGAGGGNNRILVPGGFTGGMQSA